MDMFTLSTKVEAIARVAERRGLPERHFIRDRMNGIQAMIAGHRTAAEIKQHVINMRAWYTPPGYGASIRWDNELERLADYLSSPEEILERHELAARLTESLEAAR